MKGQKARSSAKSFAGFEGGQMPLQRRLPKRGFRPINRQHWEIVNVADLNFFDANTEIDPDMLASAGLIRRASDAVKILGDGELEKPLTIRAHGFSKSAKDKIEKSGGSFEVLGG